MIKKMEISTGEVIEVTEGRPRHWGPPRRCAECGATPVFSLAYKRSTGGGLVSYWNSRRAGAVSGEK